MEHTRSIYDRVIIDWRGTSVGFPVNESFTRVVSIDGRIVLQFVKIGGRDVVSESENAVAFVVLDASFIFRTWKSPVVDVVPSVNTVSKVVISGILGLDAVRFTKSP